MISLSLSISHAPTPRSIPRPYDPGGLNPGFQPAGRLLRPTPADATRQAVSRANAQYRKLSVYKRIADIPHSGPGICLGPATAANHPLRGYRQSGQLPNVIFCRDFSLLVQWLAKIFAAPVARPYYSQPIKMVLRSARVRSQFARDRCPELLQRVRRAAPAKRCLPQPARERRVLCQFPVEGI